MCGPADGDHDPAGGLHPAAGDRHHAARRGVQLDDPDAVHHRDGHRLLRGGAPRGRACLVALTNYVFEEGVIQIALSQAFIGVSDVWILAPWMLLGVTADRGGHQPGHPAALPARLRPFR